VNVRVARVTAHLAHVCAEGGSSTRGTTLGPEAERPATAVPGGRMREGPDATWC
jgi:hypothetical protein